MATQFNFPVLGDSGALLTSVNLAWGMVGGTSVRFESVYGRFIFRDTMARMMLAPDGSMSPIDRSAANGYPINGYPLQSMTGIYPLMQAGALQYWPKADGESRTRGGGGGVVTTKPITGRRIDSTAKSLLLRPGYDPTGTLRSTIMQAEIPWGQHLVQRQVLSAMINGYILEYPNETLVCYDDKALFATDHPVNPQDPVLAGQTFSNLITQSEISEATWQDVKDKIMAVPDWNGVTLVHAEMSVPTIVVATNVQALAWIRFIGGPGADEKFHLQPVTVAGVPVGVSSVSLGDAVIVVDPYLLAIAANKTDIKKQSFIFPASPGTRPFCIVREEQVPITLVSQPNDFQGFDRKIQEVVSDAVISTGYGDPRSVFQVATP